MEDKETYTLRDDRGLMRVKFTEDTVSRLVKALPGHWRKYKGADGVASLAFEVDDDMVTGVALPFFESDGAPLVGKGKMYFWKGDLIIAPVERIGAAGFLPALARL